MIVLAEVIDKTRRSNGGPDSSHSLRRRSRQFSHRGGASRCGVPRSACLPAWTAVVRTMIFEPPTLCFASVRSLLACA